MKQPLVSSAKSHIILSFLVSFLVVLVFLPGTGPAHEKILSSGSEDEIRKIETRLTEDREQLTKLGYREKCLLDEVARLEQDVADRKEMIDNLHVRIRRAIAKSDAMKQKLSELMQASLHFQKNISKKLVETYKITRIRYLKLFSDMTAIADLIRRVKYIKLVLAEDRAALLRTAENARRQKDEVLRTEARLRELREMIRTEESRLTSLNNELEDKVHLLISINEEKKFYESAVQELETAAETLKRTLVDIEKKDVFELEQPCHFADLKGKLPYPMSGKILQDRYAPEWDRRSAYKGIVIEGPAGAEVGAVFPGKIAFSGALKGYGELVIINHGARFFTVSANLSERTKMEGEIVRGKEVVGRVGSNGSRKKGRLYFEIRMAGKSLDTQKWLTPK